MSDWKTELAGVRKQIDDLDDKLVALLNERALLAQKVGQVKAAQGQRVYAPDREKKVLDRVCSLNAGPMADSALRSVYREMMSASLALERAPRIAVLGPEGSYSHLAGRRRFGHSVEFEMVSSIAAVFDEIERDHVEYGIVPIENSIAGGVGEPLDALVDRDVSICGEFFLPIHHHLLGNCTLESVKKVYSKPEVFAQCQNWLTKTGLADRTIPTSSSSSAVRQATEEPGAAAIASELAGEIFGLSTITAHVEDDAGNVTRFLVLGKTRLQPSGSDKTSIVFGVGHRPGRLAEVLDVLRSCDINMTRIESRPDRRKRWSYLLFVDFEGHEATPEITRAIAEVENHCLFFKCLGSYPKALDGSPELSS